MHTSSFTSTGCTRNRPAFRLRPWETGQNGSGGLPSRENDGRVDMIIRGCMRLDVV